MVTYKRTCEVCGETFLAQRADTRFCQDKSTCRVTASRRKKRAEKEAQRTQMDMDTYAMYRPMCEQYPVMVNPLNMLLNNYGQEALKKFLSTLIGEIYK